MIPSLSLIPLILWLEEGRYILILSVYPNARRYGDGRLEGWSWSSASVNLACTGDLKFRNSRKIVWAAGIRASDWWTSSCVGLR